MSKALATTDAESRLYEFNARNQITLWGPDGGFIFLDIVSFCNYSLLGQILDYAGKQWSGMVSDYYIPRCEISSIIDIIHSTLCSLRWKMFFKTLEECLLTGKKFNSDDFKVVFGIVIFNKMKMF